MQLAEFNAASPRAAREVLLACAHVPRWAHRVAEGRPYASVEALLDAAFGSVEWTPEEVDAAVARHPRIGERPEGGSSEARMSRAEQSAVTGADLTARLAAGNAAYEERFGHVFLIRAAGRTGEEVLAALEERLTHTPAVERRATAGQLREIAALRLEGLLR